MRADEPFKPFWGIVDINGRDYNPFDYIRIVGCITILEFPVESIYKTFDIKQILGDRTVAFEFIKDEKGYRRLIWNTHDIKNGRLFLTEKELNDFLIPYAL